MRHHLIKVFYLILILFTIYTLEYQVPTTDIKSLGDEENYIKLVRDKRQIENFDTDSTTIQEEQEPGFWDRVIKVALRLFNRFIEWLNSS